MKTTSYFEEVFRVTCDCCGDEGPIVFHDIKHFWNAGTWSCTDRYACAERAKDNRRRLEARVKELEAREL